MKLTRRSIKMGVLGLLGGTSLASIAKANFWRGIR